MAEDQIISYLTANGDGSGANNIKVDGSVSPVIRKLSVPDWANHLRVERFRIYGEDDAVTDVDGSFLNLAPAGALAVGMVVGIFLEADDSLVLDLLAGLGVAKDNSAFASSGWDYVEIGFTAGDSMVYVERFFNTPLIVTSGQYLGVKIQDDLTAFTAARAAAIAKVEG